MIIDYQQTEDGAEGHATFPLFNATIELLINGTVPQKYVVQCLETLDVLSGSLLDALLSASKRYRESSRRGFLRLGIRTRDDILKHVTPIGITIWPPEAPGTAICVEFNCDWNNEDGMEWYIRDTTAVYVGPAQGESPWEDGSTWSMNCVSDRNGPA